jgi:hypothetical protein
MRSKVVRELTEIINNDPVSGILNNTQEMTCTPWTGHILKIENPIKMGQDSSLLDKPIDDILASIEEIAGGEYIIGSHTFYIFIERKLIADLDHIKVSLAGRDQMSSRDRFYEKSVPGQILTLLEKRFGNNLKGEGGLFTDSDADKWTKLIEAIWAYRNCICLSKDKVFPQITDGEISSTSRYVIKKNYSRGVNQGALVKSNSGYLITAVKDLKQTPTPISGGVSPEIKKAQNNTSSMNSRRKRLNLLINELNK